MRITFWRNFIFKFFGVLVFVFLFLISIPEVYAHVLKTDGNIGAVVHIDPEDDPIVGQQTTIYFDIKDKSAGTDSNGQFKAENCDCRFVVKKAGVEVFNQQLSGTTAQYNFPEKNIYTIELNGQPKLEGQFQPFHLSYEIRVEREIDQEAQSLVNQNFFENHIPHIIVIVIVAIICAFIIYREMRKKTQ